MAELINVTEYYMFKTEEDARKILDCMIQVAENYGVVTKSDFKDLINRSADYEESIHGWLEHMIKEARVVPTELGYFIEFPRAVSLV